MNKDLLLDALAAFLRNTKDMMFVKDKELRYLAASDSFSALVNKTPAEIVGKTDYDLFSDGFAIRYIADDRRILASGEPIRDYIEPIPSSDGRKHFTSTSKFAVKNERGEIVGLYGIGRDVTDIMKLENEAQAADIAKSDFLARMSHDMRTPMNGILGLIHLTLNEELPSAVRENLNKMETASKYLMGLINDTLDMNKIERKQVTLVLEPTNSRELMAAVLASIKPTIDEKGVDFTVSSQVRMVPVLADKVRLQQIFVNVLSNAIKFTPKGGHIVFSMERLSEDSETVTDRFIIRDDGVGMSEEFLPHIFEPFAQESGDDEEHSGAGLGMAITKNLISIMGGTIDVRSKKGEFTEVAVVLTFTRAKLQPVAERPAQNEFDALSGARILLCEDHPLNAEIAIRLLRAKGCVVECAENGKRGLDMFRSSDVDYYDAVLMDIRMPVMNGLEATEAIRALARGDAKKVVIVAMTANAFAEDVQKSKDAGMDGHLAKPIEPRLLFETLDTLIKRKRQG